MGLSLVLEALGRAECKLRYKTKKMEVKQNFAS